MYYSHFGLAQPPFRITPNTEFFFSGGNRGPILEALIYAINQGEGIIKVTGEVGSGKTMLCSMLQSRLSANVETVYIANPSVSPDEILRAIAQELHLDPPRDASHLEVMQLLHAHLLDRHAAQKQVVMFVEESQSMPIATLEEIRLLSNLETAHSKLLQIVLFGQPELEDNLRQPNIRQLRERITHSFRLTPFQNEDIREYLNFRVRAAGYRGPDLFTARVVNAIARSSGGLTRRINLIADKAMLAAFSENTHTIKLKHIKAAVRDSEFSHYERALPRIGLVGALSLFAIGAGIGIAMFALFQTYKPWDPAIPDTPSQPAAAPQSGTSPPQTVANPPSDLPPPSTEAAGVPAAATQAGPAAASSGSATASPPAPSQPIDPQNTKPITTVSTDLQPRSDDKGVVESRLLATQEWLGQQTPQTYSIQLLGADNDTQLKNHLNNIRKYIEINEVFVYRTIAKQKPSLTVLYGTFESRRAAQEALAKLPAPLKVYKPILRTVQGIRAEIADRRPS